MFGRRIRKALNKQAAAVWMAVLSCDKKYYNNTPHLRLEQLDMKLDEVFKK